MYSTCSGKSLGLRVCKTAPRPDTPKYNSKCLYPFTAIVPITSPFLIPIALKALASCFDLFAESEIV